MTTSVKKLGQAMIDYSSSVFRPRLFTVERAGPPGDSVWRDVGHPIVTTLAEVQANVPPDLTGDAWWGRGSIVEGDKHEPFILSNDVQKLSVTFVVGATAEKPRTLYMTFADLADVDRTGADLWFNEAHVLVPFAASNNNALATFEIRTTAKTLKLTVDAGTMPTRTRKAGYADGWASRFPCLKVAG